mmetsp:Transcript_13731/g.38658  ORF Transcript_13731/g.38658 Transcript_13731/m.38658 type:complete len:323 (-) Transcript_13731:752-1720(-)
MNRSAAHPKFSDLLVLLFFEVLLLFAAPSSSFVAHRLLGSSTLTKNMATETGGGESVAFPREVCKERRHDNHTAGFIPLIDIGTTTTSADTNAVESTPLSREIAIDLVSALRNSGFALVRSPLLSKDLQSRAIEAASRYLAESSETSDDGNPSKTGNETTKVDVIPHPTDPKVYAMLDSEDQFDLVAPDSKAITEYVRALRSIKTEVLRLIATGLDMNDADFFCQAPRRRQRHAASHHVLSDPFGNDRKSVQGAFGLRNDHVAVDGLRVGIGVVPRRNVASRSPHRRSAGGECRFPARRVDEGNPARNSSSRRRPGIGEQRE